MEDHHQHQYYFYDDEEDSVESSAPSEDMWKKFQLVGASPGAGPEWACQAPWRDEDPDWLGAEAGRASPVILRDCRWSCVSSGERLDSVSVRDVPSGPSGLADPPSSGWEPRPRPQSRPSRSSKSQKHKLRERKRRHALRSRFRALREQIPGLSDHPRTPTAAVLSEAVDHLHALHQLHSQKIREKRRLKSRQQQLLLRLARLKQTTPTTSSASSP